MKYKILFFFFVIITFFYLLQPTKTKIIEDFTSQNCYFIKMDQQYLTVSYEENQSHVYLENKSNKPRYYKTNKTFLDYNVNINLEQSQKFYFVLVPEKDNIYMIRTKDKPYLYLKANCNNISTSLFSGSSDQYWYIDTKDGVTIGSYKLPNKFLGRKSKKGGYLFPERRGTVYLSSKKHEWKIINCSKHTPQSVHASKLSHASKLLSTSTQPPTSMPPTSMPPTSMPPTSMPPTSMPPTSMPPTSMPPTSMPPTSLPP